MSKDLTNTIEAFVALLNERDREINRLEGALQVAREDISAMANSLERLRANSAPAPQGDFSDILAPDGMINRLRREAEAAEENARHLSPLAEEEQKGYARGLKQAAKIVAKKWEESQS